MKKPHFLQKLYIKLSMNWVTYLLLAIILFIAVLAVVLISLGVSNYFGMEPFSRKQMMSQMGIYMIVGVIQAAVFVGMFQIAHYFQMNGGMLKRLGQEKINLAKTDVDWDDVIGMESAKKEAWEVVELLRDQSLLKKIGGKIVKGTMMIGPPGCGKTYLAKAMASACGLPLLSANGAEFVGMFVGQGAAQMRSLFKQARSIAALEGGCIIFIDEIDAFARPRMADTGFGGGISHNATINQFLTDMDGLRKSENNIVVIAATNFGEEELDSAIMRAGRFDRKIYVERPNLDERKKIFDFYINKVKTENVNSDIMARRTLYSTPADIEAIVREAGIVALREKREIISMKDMSEAYDWITYGDKSNMIVRDEDRLWTAHHEAGHAILAYLIHPKDDVVKATVIPRRGCYGFISHKPQYEHHSYNKEYFLAQIKISIASYVAEQMTYGGNSSSGVGGGPGADFNTALSIARRMVWAFGMGKSGYIGDYLTTGVHHYSGSNMVSNEIREVLERDVQDILQSCLKDVKEILTQHKELYEYFAKELFEKKELEYDEIQAIFDKFDVKPISGRPLPKLG